MQNYKNVFINPLYEGNAANTQEEQHQESERLTLPLLTAAPQPEAPKPAAQPAVLPEVAAITVQIKALKKLPTFHSYFSPVIFIGLAFNYLTTRALVSGKSCNVGPKFGLTTMYVQLATYMTFAASNYMASVVEGKLTTHKEQDGVATLKKVANSKVNRYLVLVTLLLSLLGGALFIASMINTFQIKAGKLSCQSAKAFVVLTFLCGTLGSIFIGNCYPVVFAFVYKEGGNYSYWKFLSPEA